jgi:hypothetical protein
MNVINPRNSGRKLGSKQKVSQKEIQLANELRCFIKDNNLNLNVIRTKLGMRNSCIYYFMKEKTYLVAWLPQLEQLFKNNLIKQANE